METNFCPHCGTSSSSTDLFCEACGINFSKYFEKIEYRATDNQPTNLNMTNLAWFDKLRHFNTKKLIIIIIITLFIINFVIGVGIRKIYISNIEVSPNGEYYAISEDHVYPGYQKGILIIFETATNSQIATLSTSGLIFFIEWGPNSDKLYLITEKSFLSSRTIVVSYDILRGTTQEYNLNTILEYLDVSPDGQNIFFLNKNGYGGMFNFQSRSMDIFQDLFRRTSDWINNEEIYLIKQYNYNNYDNVGEILLYNLSNDTFNITNLKQVNTLKLSPNQEHIAIETDTEIEILKMVNSTYFSNSSNHIINQIPSESIMWSFDSNQILIDPLYAGSPLIYNLDTHSVKLLSVQFPNGVSWHPDSQRYFMGDYHYTNQGIELIGVSDGSYEYIYLPVHKFGSFIMSALVQTLYMSSILGFVFLIYSLIRKLKIISNKAKSSQSPLFSNSKKALDIEPKTFFSVLKQSIRDYLIGLPNWGKVITLVFVIVIIFIVSVYGAFIIGIFTTFTFLPLYFIVIFVVLLIVEWRKF